MNNKYDIFISYRRAGGAQYARILQLMLIQRGYRVFLDYDELTDGIFSDKIRQAIREASVFMLVLSQHSMDRCANDGDWVREEITLAVQLQKHIIPVNPDNSFDGFPTGMPQQLQEAIGSHQHSEISFGQALGATIDLMIKNRIAPTLGDRQAKGKVDTDYDTAQESLRRQDLHQRFMRRLATAGTALITAIVLGTCLLVWKSHRDKMQAEEEAAALAQLREEVEQRYVALGLQFSPGVTATQVLAVDTLLQNLTVVIPDELWMSQFEFTRGLWNDISQQPCKPAERSMPVTSESFADVSMFLSTLSDMTNLTVTLPTAEEWEYAARGADNRESTLYAGSNDPDSVAWYKDNSGSVPHPSDGQRGMVPNTIDLFDMSGNVAELCNTPFAPGTPNSPYTVCGGHYDSPAEQVTVTSRQGLDTAAKDPHVGFRPVIRKP